MSRVFAFKDNIGVYYVFNSAKTSLLGIAFDISNPDYSRWEDIANLSTLTPDQLRLVSGLSLCIHSDIEDDEYNLGESRIIDYKGEELSSIMEGEGLASAVLQFDEMYDFRDKCTVLNDIKPSYEVKMLCVK